MSILKSTNSGGCTKLTIELLRSWGWDWGFIAEPMHFDLDYTKLVRDFRHEDECLHIDRQTIGDPKKDYWFYAKFHKESGPEDEYNWDVQVYPSTVLELSKIECFWDKARKGPVDPIEEFKDCKFAIITATAKK